MGERESGRQSAHQKSSRPREVGSDQPRKRRDANKPARSGQKPGVEGKHTKDEIDAKKGGNSMLS